MKGEGRGREVGREKRVDAHTVTGRLDASDLTDPNP